MTKRDIMNYVDMELKYVETPDDMFSVIDKMEGFRAAIIYTDNQEMIDFVFSYWNSQFHKKLETLF